MGAVVGWGGEMRGSYFVWGLGVERNKQGGVMGVMGLKDIVLISASGD